MKILRWHIFGWLIALFGVMPLGGMNLSRMKGFKDWHGIRTVPLSGMKKSGYHNTSSSWWQSFIPSWLGGGSKSTSELVQEHSLIPLKKEEPAISVVNLFSTFQKKDPIVESLFMDLREKLKKSNNDLPIFDISFFRNLIILQNNIDKKKYNPINQTDFLEHTFFYDFLFAVINNLEKEFLLKDRKNNLTTMIEVIKKLGAVLSITDVVDLQERIKEKYKTFIEKKDKKLSELYSFAMMVNFYEMAGLDMSFFNIDMNKIHNFIQYCYKHYDLYQVCIQYENNQLKLDTEDIINKFTQYQFGLTIKSFDPSDKFEVEVRVANGPSDTITSSKAIGDMVKNGELSGYILNTVFKNSRVLQCIEKYNEWRIQSEFGRHARHEMSRFLNDFYTKYEVIGLDGQRTLRDIRNVSQFRQLLTESNANEITKIVKNLDEFRNHADFTKSEKGPVYLPSNSFDSFYNALMQDGKYIGNDLLYRLFQKEYGEMPLKAKVRSGLSQDEADKITQKIKILNNARDEYKRKDENRM